MTNAHQATFAFMQAWQIANKELWCMFQQQSWAEGTLLRDSSNNELLIINLATVREENFFYGFHN